MAESIPGSVGPNMLVACFTAIMNHVVAFGDGLVAAGVFDWFLDDLAIHVRNASSHQITCVVLGAAIHALEDFMFHRQYWDLATFEIYDESDRIRSRKGCSDGWRLCLRLKGRRVDDACTVCFCSSIQQYLIPCPSLALKVWECF